MNHSEGHLTCSNAGLINIICSSNLPYDFSCITHFDFLSPFILLNSTFDFPQKQLKSAVGAVKSYCRLEVVSKLKHSYYLFALGVTEETKKTRCRFSNHGSEQQYPADRTLQWFNLKRAAPRRWKRKKHSTQGELTWLWMIRTASCFKRNFLTPEDRKMNTNWVRIGEIVIYDLLTCLCVSITYIDISCWRNR